MIVNSGKSFVNKMNTCFNENFYKVEKEITEIIYQMYAIMPSLKAK